MAAAAAQQQPVIQEGPVMVGVKNIFFKGHPTINYFAEESDEEAIENDVAFQHFNKSLECSNKYGCLFLTFNNGFFLIRTGDVLGTQENRTFEELKKLEIRNDALPAVPNIISLSNGEEFLAVDTIRGDSGWVVIFKLTDFVNQAGSCRPFCEIRCSHSSAVRVSGICWNPGENMSNMIAINSDDGALFLAKIIGPSNVELSKLAETNIRSVCWSPKGKQLVVGRTNGSLSQLKLDLSLAKQIPAPEPGCIPISILWTQTTQFLVVFQKEDGIDFMQLDVAKGTPPTFSKSGDIFISDIIPEKSSCYFIPFVQWNVVVAMTNTSSDIVVLVKESQNQNEFWVPGDIADNRRAMFRLDNSTRGVAVFYGSESSVVFSEVESYSPMPVIFLLSQRGSLSAYSIINSAPDAASLSVKVTERVPDSIFSASQPAAKQTTQTTPSLTASQPQPQPTSFSQETKPSLPTATLNFGSTGQPSLFQSQSASLSAPQFSQSSSLFKPNNQTLSSTPPAQLSSQQQAQFASLTPDTKPQTQSPKTFSTQQQQQQPPKLGSGDSGQPQLSNLRQLGTSTLPSSIDMAGLQKAVEEKRREMTTQLQKTSGASLKGLEDDNHCGFVVSEVRNFEQKLADFKEKIESNREMIKQMLNAASNTLEKSVLPALNSVEDFNSDMVSTTSAQKEEVDVLKERILNHFSQLEYTKSLVERSRDPRYLQHLRSRPLDPASQQKFEEIVKLHNYLRMQAAECRRYFYEQNRKRDLSLDRAPNTQTQLIYATLSNHSKIIRRLKVELDSIKERLGLGRHTISFDEAEFLAVCEASFPTSKKPSTTSKQNEDQDEITLSDLTAGISKVKLNRDSSRPDRKPIKFSSRKLLILSKTMPDVSVVKVKADETAWTRTPGKSTRPKPITYPTAENSFPRPVESVAKSDATPPSFGSTYVINSASNTPFTTGNNGPNSFFKPSVAPQSQSNALFANKNTTVASSSQQAFASTQKPVEDSAITAPKPTFSTIPSTSTPVKTSPQQQQQPNPGMINFTSKGFSAETIPSAKQLPTLAELLATPSSATQFGGASSSSKPAASTSSTSGSGFPDLNISFGSSAGLTVNSKNIFGAGAFSAALQGKEESTTTTSVGSSTTQFQGYRTIPTPPPVQPTATTTSTNPTTESSSLKVNTPPSLGTNTAGSGKTQPTTTPAADSKSSQQLPSFTSPLGTTSMFGGQRSGEGEGPRSQSSLPLAFGISTATVAGSLGKTPPSSSGLFSGLSTAPLSSTIQFPGFSTALNLSTDATNKSSNSPAAPSSTSGTTGNINPTNTVSFGSPSGGSGLFGQVSASKTTTPTDTASTTVKTTAPTSTVSSKPPDSSVSSTTSSVPAPAATTVTSSSPNKSFGNVNVDPSNAATPTPVSTTSTNTGGLFSSPSSLFAPSTTAPAPNIFGSAGQASFTSPTSISSPGLFGTPPTTAAAPTNTSTGSVGTAQVQAGVTSSSTTSTSLFGSPSPGFFSQTTAPVGGTTASGTGGFMSSLSISDPAAKPTASTTPAPGGLFSTPAFGSAPSTGSIFGGSGNVFGSQTPASGTKPATSGIFGSPSATATTVFGGAPAFGSASPFGSSFGGTGTSAFGGGGSVFGSTTTATSTTQTTGFGALAQQGGNASSPFGGSVFGSSGQQQQQPSLFGSPVQQKPAASGGLFTSTFGSPPASTTSGTGSIFGGGASSFGAPSSGGIFSSGASGGVAQQGFGFASPKPTSGFGSPPSGGPVFGGGATFGSTSPFGTSFSSPTASTFGTSGASVFGGAAATQPNTGFGALAQQGSTSPGFGSSPFGSSGQQQIPSLFGSPPPQPQQQKPTFGGQAFSSWR